MTRPLKPYQRHAAMLALTVALCRITAWATSQKERLASIRRAAQDKPYLIVTPVAFPEAEPPGVGSEVLQRITRLCVPADVPPNSAHLPKFSIRYGDGPDSERTAQWLASSLGGDASHAAWLVDGVEPTRLRFALDSKLGRLSEGSRLIVIPDAGPAVLLGHESSSLVTLRVGPASRP